MRASRDWVKRNLGFDPIATPAPAESFAHKVAATPRAQPEDFQREIIDFDSEGPEGAAFFAFSTATGLSRFTDIPWPKSLAPKTRQRGPQGRRRRVAQGRRAHRDLDRGRGSRLEPRSDAGQGLPQRLRPVQAQLREDFQEDAQGVSGAAGGTAGRVLDDEHRGKEGRHLQIGLPPFAGREARPHRRTDPAERGCVAADHCGGESDARDHDRHGRRHRHAMRSGRCRREPHRALRLPELAQEGAVRHRHLS